MEIQADPPILDHCCLDIQVPVTMIFNVGDLCRSVSLGHIHSGNSEAVYVYILGERIAFLMYFYIDMECNLF